MHSCFQVYLRYPTRYANYLRKVIATWMADNEVNMNYVIPCEAANTDRLRSTKNDQLHSHEDEDPKEPRPKKPRPKKHDACASKKGQVADHLGNVSDANTDREIPGKKQCYAREEKL